jgi:CRISPR system Cascade subunit CasD
MRPSVKSWKKFLGDEAMDILMLRFDAPLMSFGGVMVDQNGPTDRFPGLSMLAGLFTNALGYYHGDVEKLQRLQSRIEYAARWDVEPEMVLDYHTVDLGLPKMRGAGWTTRGKPEHRGGGPEAKYGIHQRFRYYWANGIMTITVALKEDEKPDILELEDALTCPARPLYLGRKTCLPASPLFVCHMQARDVLSALKEAPRITRPGYSPTWKEMEACWPNHLGIGPGIREVVVYDQRDWRNQIHMGSRIRSEGWIKEVAS